MPIENDTRIRSAVGARNACARRAQLAGAVLLIGALGGCAAPQPASPRPAASADESLARSAPTDLASRPLYEFDEADLDRYLRWLHVAEPDATRRVVHLARKGLGQPYDIYLLGEFPYEFYDPDPIYNLQRSDCLTFCEHIYAMALGHDFWTFLRNLQRLRYRDGVIGMLSRNHYTEADWNPANAFLFDDVTRRLGQGAVHAPMNMVCRRAEFFRQFGIGEDVPDEPVRDAYVPTERVPQILSELRDGDMVNIVRGDAQSQWVGHTGLIVHGPDGTVNFLHSAQPRVREQPLMDYLRTNKRCLGAKFLRLRADPDRRMADALLYPPASEVSEAALRSATALSPLMDVGRPAGYGEDWMRAMHTQGYRLDYDTPTDPALQARLEALDALIGPSLGIPQAERAFGVLDLTDLRLALVQPDVMFYGASVPKVCIALAYFEKFPGAAADLPPEAARELGLVLKRSDNELAAKYSQMLGLDFIQKTIESPRYRFYDKEHGGGFWCGKHYGVEQPRIGDPLADNSHALTVRQALRYYLLLEQGKLASAAASARLKELFAAPELEFHDSYFVHGLKGRPVTMIRKSGTWEEWHHDTARVQHGERVYLLAGCTKHPQGGEYLAQMAAAIDEELCGPSERPPYRHELELQAGRAAFERGSLRGGRLQAEAVALDAAPGDGAEFISGEVRPRAKFNEVVLSWNVETPPGTGVAIDLRVGRRADDSWSPWLFVDDWGDAPPQGERLRKFDGGYIDVDYFRSNERYDRVQYRIRGAGAAGQTSRIDRVGVCTSDLTGLPDSFAPQPPAAIAAAGDSTRRLPVPFRSQRVEPRELAGRICSPTSLAMVLSYRGIEKTTRSVVDACYDAANKIYGNWPRNVQAGFALGAPGWLERFSDWAAVERKIAEDQPLIISIRVHNEGGLANAPYRKTDGHLLVLCGFDSAGNVLVNDPAAPTAEKGMLAYSRSDLEEVWMRATGGLAYIIASPPAQHAGR